MRTLVKAIFIGTGMVGMVWLPLYAEKTWTCAECGKKNSEHVYRCKKCGALKEWGP